MPDYSEHLILARKLLANAEAAALNRLWPAAAEAAQAASIAAERLELELRREERDR